MTSFIRKQIELCERNTLLEYIILFVIDMGGARAIAVVVCLLFAWIDGAVTIHAINKS